MDMAALLIGARINIGILINGKCSLASSPDRNWAYLAEPSLLDKATWSIHQFRYPGFKFRTVPGLWSDFQPVREILKNDKQSANLSGQMRTESMLLEADMSVMSKLSRNAVD